MAPHPQMIKSQTMKINEFQSTMIEFEAENERLRQLQFDNDNTQKLQQMIVENEAQNKKIEKLLHRIEELENEPMKTRWIR